MEKKGGEGGEGDGERDLLVYSFASGLKLLTEVRKGVML